MRVSVSSCSVLVYMLTHVHECFIEKEFSYYEKGKVQYILSTPIRKNDFLGIVALSAGGISQYSFPSYSKGKGEPNS